MPKQRKKRPSTQNEISVTCKLLRLHLRNHPDELRIEAINECLRMLNALRDEEEQKATQAYLQANALNDQVPK